jgi:hypothetical protein
VTLALDPAVSGALRGALALLLLSAAAHKLRDPVGFRAAVAAYGLLPARALPAAAGLLAPAELAIGAALLVPAAGPAAGCAGASLLALYALAMLAALAAGRRGIDCGCAVALGARRLGPATVARSAVLAVAALATSLPASPRPLVWLDALTATGAIAVLGCLFAAAELSLEQAGRARALRRREA